jgi:pimeloyl-ACP methyl ester carboxylesterase
MAALGQVDPAAAHPVHRRACQTRFTWTWGLVGFSVMHARTFLLALALAACGARSSRSPSTVPAPAGDRDLEGSKLHLFMRVIEGSAPAIVLEAGGGADSSRWHTLPEQLARATGRQVIAYDRAGFGKTPLPPGELTVGDEVDALHADLRRAGATKIVFVAESYGAMITLAYVQRYPDDLAGLVLLDPMNADFVTAVGIERVARTAGPSNSHPRTEKERAIARMVSVFPGLVGELTNKRWPDVPAIVVTAGIPWWPDEGMRPPWRASHEALARTPGAELVLAEDSKHDIAGTRPDLVLAWVQRVLAHVHERKADAPARSRSPSPPPRAPG